MHRRRGAHGHFLRRPPLEAQDRGLARNNSTFRHRERGQNTVAARDRDQFAIRINARDAANIWIDRARFFDIHRRAHCSDFDQAQNRVGVDQPGVNMLARGVDHLCAGGNGRISADRGDFSIFKNDRARCDIRPADRMKSSRLSARSASPGAALGWYRRREHSRLCTRDNEQHCRRGYPELRGAFHCDASSVQVCLS